MQYRNLAQQAFNRAKVELASKDPNRIKYCVLELRMAFEALIYQKATNYTEELSGKKLNTWQPAKLLDLLLEIDPYADQTSTLRFKVEGKDGQPDGEMKTLGTERPLKLKEIKKNYHKLGSFLHTPTIEQVVDNKESKPEKIEKSCRKIFEILEKVFSSTIWNNNFKVTATTNCINCNNKIIRRIPPNKEMVIANCINCDASYELISVNEKQVQWNPIQRKIKCANPSCDAEFFFWDRELTLNSKWECKSCKGENHIVPGISYISL
ncbi:MAG: hypothetical protein KKE62_06405 [Proteobacteria bacterium]|nr:hypothetical protein [Pseudomonadota bacterium]MBU1542461.1 hypothetical protein [Pseudomonadota bacterium]MBU2481767.1 hypothetical protein [Pseudomonadota bacterium]